MVTTKESIAIVNDHILGPMARAWSVPPHLKTTEHVQAFTPIFLRAIAELNPTIEEAKAALLSVAQTHDRAYWPPAATFCKAIFQARKDAREHKPESEHKPLAIAGPPPRMMIGDDKVHKLAEAIFAGPYGAIILREGLACALLELIADGIITGENEIDQHAFSRMRRIHTAFLDALATADHQQATMPEMVELLRLGKALANHAADLRDRYIGSR